MSQPRSSRRLGAWGARWALSTAMAVVSLNVVVGQEPGKPAPPAAPPKSSAEAVQMYADAASFQNRKAFEIAADEWTRFLQRFADDPLAPMATYYLGVCKIQLQQLAEAAAQFQRVIDKYPKFEQLEDAYLKLGWCQYSLGGQGDKALYTQAAETFARQLKGYPDGKNADQALFYQGESYYALGKRKEAALAYGQVATRFEQSALRIDALYALGVTLEELGEYAQAGKAYDMFLEKYASHALAVEVRMRKAETILQQGDAAQAEPMFAAAAAVEGFAAADHALFRQAFCTARQEKFAAAAALYAQLPERFPKSVYVAEAAMAAGRCYYRAGEDGPAATWFQRVMDLKGADAVEAAHWLCRILLRQQKAAEVLALADRILPQAGTDAFAANLMLDAADALYALEGRGEEAMAKYREIAKKYPDHEVAAQALYNGAFAAMEHKQYDLAVQDVERFLAAYPQHTLVPDVQLVLAECRIQQKQHPAAEALFRQLIKDYPEHPQQETWHVRLALVLYLQQPQQALDWLASSADRIQTAEAKAEARYIAGLSHFQLAQYAEALSQLRESLLASAKWRQADEVTLYVARCQLKLGQRDEARSTLEGIPQSFPDSRLLDQVAYRLGELHYAAGRYPEALAAYDEVLAKWPQSEFVPLVRYGKAWALMKSGKYAEAVESLSALIDLQPPHVLRPDALLARGMCRRQLKQLTEAIADLDAFLGTQPDDATRADALYERGLAEGAAKQLDKAIQTYNLLLTEQPGYRAADQVLYELAWACKTSGKEPEANAAFARLVESHPQSPLATEARFHVAEQLYRDGKYTEAAGLYTQVVTQAQDATLREKALYKLGWSHYQAQQYPEARAQFTAQLEAFPEGGLAADARFMRAECLFKLKDYQAALPAFQEAARQPPSTPDIAVLTLLHGAQSAGQLGQWKQVLEMIEPLFAKFPDSPYLAEAYFERGRARQKLDQLDEAVQDYQQAVDRTRGEVGARAQFMIGEVRFGQKQYGEAVKNFQRVMFRHVNPELEAEVRPWQVKAAFEAGRCAEVQIEQAQATADRNQKLDEAVKFYQFVIEQDPGSDLGEQASKRLAALKKL